jgi:hypothetical protein
MKRRLVMLMIGLAVGLTACGGSSSPKEEPAAETAPAAEPEEAEEVQEEPAEEPEEENVEETTEAAPEETEAEAEVKEAAEAPAPKEDFPYDVTFYKEVRNDKTGRWRMGVMAEAVQVQDIALDYWNHFAESSDEVHVVVNFAYNTTTVINRYGDMLVMDVHEYVDGEEHDADIAGSGQYLGTFTVDCTTGEVTEIKAN